MTLCPIQLTSGENEEEGFPLQKKKKKKGVPVKFDTAFPEQQRKTKTDQERDPDYTHKGRQRKSFSKLVGRRNCGLTRSLLHLKQPNQQLNEVDSAFSYK